MERETAGGSEPKPLTSADLRRPLRGDDQARAVSEEGRAYLAAQVEQGMADAHVGPLLATIAERDAEIEQLRAKLREAGGKEVDA